MCLSSALGVPAGLCVYKKGQDDIEQKAKVKNKHGKKCSLNFNLYLKDQRSGETLYLLYVLSLCAIKD